ncbi:hypothetical protein ACYTR9_23995, partial [Vibrio antiquarius]
RQVVHSAQIKTIEQQCIKALRNVRQCLVDNRITLVSQSRAMTTEYGVIYPNHVTKLQEILSLAFEGASNQQSYVMRRLLLENYGLSYLEMVGCLRKFSMSTFSISSQQNLIVVAKWIWPLN